MQGRGELVLESPHGATRHISTMFIVLNGPLGIGKSTLAEALMESIDYCVMLEGDRLLAATPPPADELEQLHSTIALLVTHYRRLGYRHFVIDHLWRSPAELADLHRTLAAIDDEAEVRTFLLTLPSEENLQRIRRRQSARAIDEHEFELGTFRQERELLAKRTDVGDPFDVSAPPAELVRIMLACLALV
jgi:hypothetical protein